jgi:hypothetical protein
MLEQSQGIGFEGEAGSRVGVWRPVQLFLTPVPGRGDDHDSGSCDVLGVLFHRGFPLLQRPHRGRRVVLDPIP